ncbi:MAG: glutamine--fructose-6-phosphate transaminase (isomerizing) [Candidatus Diapherotrites archaeon]|uniref:Glutamine--fructose-6-phosphate aminotransferase [isomerizing] n=1 Tax=Candidatus Iainarchaeum sp. TaxID=3101447 RepID=A0A8T4KTF8_9ARCH|nr:glutamine--fructose-6-phosphate transaminase (isomerizing) [Candidatus Diapherotrites archaeon]
MCGIIGYLGKQNSLPIILEGLKRMEYRGYDSAGVALLVDRELKVFKKEGKLDNLKKVLFGFNPQSFIGLGHIRWATHGVPSDLNAHPHVDCQGRLAIVHNGIVENMADLKKELLEQGHQIKSQTDSELIAHLIESHYTGNNLVEAVRQALDRIKGTYGLAILSKTEPEKLVVARLSSPLILGLIPSGGYLIASDVTAMLPFTKEVVYLEDDEIAEVSVDSYKIYKSGETENLIRQSQSVDWDVAEAEKGGYDHFMLKEISEEPRAIADSLRGRLLVEEGNVKLGGLIDVMDRLQEARRIIFVACGTAHYAGRIGEYLIESQVGMPAEVEYASEFRYREAVLEEGTIVIAVSQSGETADTLAAIRQAKKLGALTLGIVNNVGSSITRETAAGVYNHIGPEISVASTKAFVSQLVILVLLTILLGRQRRMSQEKARKIIEELQALPIKAEKIIVLKDQLEKIAQKYYNSRDFIFIGRKLNYPIALEGALKLKEISYIHAEGYPAGELKHGPLALIDETWPVVCLIPQDSVYEKNLSNIQEIKARNGKVIAIATEGDPKIAELADEVVYVPKTLEILYPILTVIPLQLLAYFIAKKKGCPIDQPRNLAKSVTVE